MAKQTTAEVMNVLGMTRNILLRTLAYHQELRPRTQLTTLNLARLNQTLWSEAEIERVRLYRTTHKWLHAA